MHPGDNLSSASVIALDVETGKIRGPYIAVQSRWGVDAQRMQARLDTFLGTTTEVPQGGVVWVFAVRD